jgi:hypothetical protein
VKILFSFVLVSLFHSGFSHGQARVETQEHKPDIYILPRLGMSLSKSTVTINPPEQVSYISGITGGLGVEFRIWRGLNLLTEVSFINKGFNSHGQQTNGNLASDSKIRQKYGYLELPLMLRKRFGTGNIRFYLNAGLFLDYCLKASRTLTYFTKVHGSGPYTSYESVDYTIYFGPEPQNPPNGSFYINTRGDYGTVAGGGVIIFNKVIVDARYLAGSKNMELGSSKNKSFSVSLGYQIVYRKTAK